MMVRAVAFAAVCLAAVAASASHTESAAPTGSLVAAFAAEPTTLDPVRYSAGVDTYGISQVFEQLIRVDPSGKTVNWLAESWSVGGTDDKPVIDVHLRPGVRFQNGDPLTAADVEFSFERLRDPKQSRWSHLQAAVEQFELVDDLHFRLHFSRPDATYVTDYLQLWVMPKRYFEQAGADGFARAPIGTGPWRVIEWRVKEELRLQAWESYWNREQRPGVRDLTIKFIPEDLTRVAAFKTGAVDWIDAVPPAAVEEFRRMPGVSTTTKVSGNNLYIDFPTQLANTPFKDARVRQAAAYAVDMDAIIKRVLFGQGQRYVEIAPDETGYDPALKPYLFDPKKAKALLAEAGFPRGFDTPCYNLTTPREPNVKEMGDAVFAYLSAAGIRCKVTELEYGAWINLGRRGRSGPPEMDGVLSWMWSHGVPGDPGTPWAGHLHSFQPGQGWGSYSYTDVPEMDALIERQKQTLDPAKRAALLQEIARKKHDEVLGGLTTYRPLVTLAWRTDKVAFTPWPWPGAWHGFQQISIKPPGAANG